MARVYLKCHWEQPFNCFLYFQVQHLPRDVPRNAGGVPTPARSSVHAVPRERSGVLRAHGPRHAGRHVVRQPHGRDRRLPVLVPGTGRRAWLHLHRGRQDTTADETEEAFERETD